MKIPFIVLTISLMTAMMSLSAIAGPRVGNGGGTWICKDKASQKERWIQLVDLFEAREEFGYTLANTEGLTYWQIIDQRVEEVRTRLPVLQSLLTRTPAEIKAILRMMPDNTSLTRVDDGSIRVHPRPGSCIDGYIYYGQLANFTDDGRLLVDGQIWQNPEVTETDRAALLIHEVVYKSLRDSRGDTNSSRSRHIVAILFSNLDSVAKANAIYAVLQVEAPKDDTSDVILDPFDLFCRATVTGTNGSYLQFAFQNSMKPGLSYKTDLGTYTFQIDVDSVTSLPSKLAITNRISNVSTGLSRDIIQTVISHNHKVGTTLDDNENQTSALFACEIHLIQQ